ncbi:helix-turn-helix domain-containing protein [Pontixanthobacter aquaemixtae]|uniref:DUF4115 domain-containing protein n=1 Tax=Pontixanthobacter aquaemixtae TaxID=1958940 RepID=A0A844ZV17_9SPHN|nr:helix-turn-helix domain-containing protein [Pontixanthobacter aquaemixtae]MXO89389.1 DUF4115 domain-containing protein [Pontixanthobacter aquaemixtae]
MSEEGEQPEGELPLEGAGQRLRRAREDAGKTIEQIAASTRIPQRHLEVIESGDFAALPAKTYAIGFARSYAREVGLDEKEITSLVREEMAGDSEAFADPHRGSTFEPSDPARIPSRKLAWFSLFAAILLVAGSLAYFRDYFFPGSGPGSIVAGEETAPRDAGVETPSDAGPAQPDPTGTVVFTSTEEGVWVKFYDAAGERLMEKEMAQGESYTVPADAEGPQVWTGQPESLEIRIGGTAIGTLSNTSEVVRDIPVTAEALNARIAELEAEQSAEDEATGSAEVSSGSSGNDSDG